jgi:hypothetical protein
MGRIVSLANLEQFAAVNLLSDPGLILGPKVVTNCIQIVFGWNLAGSKIGHNVLYGRYASPPTLTPAMADAIKAALTSERTGQAKFRGRVTSAGQLKGDFLQAGNKAPCVLQKTGPPQVELPRKSTAISQELEGEWKGGYELFGYPRKVTIKLQNRGSEGAIAEFVIVGRKENKLPVDRVVQQGEFVTVDSHETGLSFEGRARKDEIQGTIFQGPLEIPVTLRRTN